MNNNNEFLPSGYKLPENRNYLRLKDGENTFRVLSSAIVGWEYWTKDGKPVRSRTPFTTLPADIRIEKDGTPSRIKHFWAFAVWNYNAGAVQIFEVTQSTIQGAIKAIVDNPKWGDPKGYDITIIRSGEGLETEYNVMPNPHSPLEEQVKLIYQNKKINLEALYENKDPFSNEEV